MDYYRRYVGDYLADTQGLTMTEDGAYGRMLDYYYAREAPLPGQLDAVYRIARATTPAERKAVASVLAQHFELRDGGYHNARADRELGEALPRIEKLREVARENGKKGGRPKSKTGSSEKPAPEPKPEPDPVPNGKQPAGVKQPPTASHQPPSKPSSSAFPVSTTSGPPDAPAAAGSDQSRNPERLAFVLAECARAKVNDAGPDSGVVLRWINTATNTQIAKALADSRLPFRKPFPQMLSVAYVDVVLNEIVDLDAKARKAADAKAQATQQQIAEQRAAAERAAPMPEHLIPRKRQASA